MPSATVAAQNLNHWNQASRQYSHVSRLFAPEAWFLRTYCELLRTSALLDLGIGAGRTTRHFAPACRTYAGVDYAPVMVTEACLNCQDHARCLKQGDARDLSRFADGSFDFVLFSFNGLDCIAPEDRMTVLREVHRVLRPGGIFSFSSHNLDSLPMRGSWPLPSLHPGQPLHAAYRLLQRMKRNLRIRPLVRNWNPAEVRERGWACFADGGESYEVPLYYVSADRQFEELSLAGMRLFSVQDRDCTELLSEPGLISADSWLYYLAEKPL